MERQAGAVATALGLLLLLLTKCERPLVPNNPAAFWHQKAPDAWTPAECHSIFLGTPWASLGAARFDGRFAKESPWMVGVLWESAAPFIAASNCVKFAIPGPEDLAKYYVVAVQGVDIASIRMAGPDDYQAWLGRPGKLSIPCSRLRIMPYGIRYYFPKNDPIVIEDIDVTFETKTGTMETSTKFHLPDMVWKGKLAL